MATPASSATSYCSVAQFLSYYDWRTVADLCVDTGVRATLSSLTSDPTLAAVLLSASGRVEAACTRGQRYLITATVNDLSALTGASQALLQKLVADLAFGFLFERRPQPGVEPPISYQLAIATLDQLRDGELVFGLIESQAAGRPSHYVENEQDVLGRRMTTSICSRFFGRRSNRYNQSQQ